MGWHAGRKLRRVVDNLRMILAVEYVSAGRAIDGRMPLKPGKVTGEWLARLRKVVPGIGPDRFLAPELEAAAELLR
jgi:histidine ammonia-lyase